MAGTWQVDNCCGCGCVEVKVRVAFGLWMGHQGHLWLTNQAASERYARYDRTQTADGDTDPTYHEWWEINVWTGATVAQGSTGIPWTWWGGDARTTITETDSSWVRHNDTQGFTENQSWTGVNTRSAAAQAVVDVCQALSPDWGECCTVYQDGFATFAGAGTSNNAYTNGPFSATAGMEWTNTVSGTGGIGAAVPITGISFTNGDGCRLSKISCASCMAMTDGLPSSAPADTFCGWILAVETEIQGLTSDYDLIVYNPVSGAEVSTTTISYSGGTIITSPVVGSYVMNVVDPEPAI